MVVVVNNDHYFVKYVKVLINMLNINKNEGGSLLKLRSNFFSINPDETLIKFKNCF